MTYQEFVDKIAPIYQEAETKLREAVQAEAAELGNNVPAGETTSEQREQIKHTGGTMNKVANLKYCIFNMANESVKWTGYTDDAPLSVKRGFVVYAYDKIKTANDGMFGMIGTGSEDFARGRYLKRMEQGGPQFLELVQEYFI